MNQKRTTHSPAFKAKVALAAIRQEKTLSQLAASHNVHSTVISKWKAHVLENIASLFVDGRAKKSQKDNDTDMKALYEKIGRLEVELDFLKKKCDQLK